MNGDIVALDPAADARWVEWQTRGAAADRRSARAMRWVLATLVTLPVGWLLVQLL